PHPHPRNTCSIAFHCFFVSRNTTPHGVIPPPLRNVSASVSPSSFSRVRNAFSIAYAAFVTEHTPHGNKRPLLPPMHGIQHRTVKSRGRRATYPHPYLGIRNAFSMAFAEFMT
ncbi:unnamed protein product, partial [Ectocarpus sp. 12 AP-2014]